MKTLRIILAATLLGVPALNAQLVADSATNTLSNVTTNIPGSVTVGANGSFTLLVLSNNCLVTNSGVGVIGQNTAAKSNEVRLVSATARWLMGGQLFVGNNGSFNRLAVNSGAQVTNSLGTIGNSISASNNTAVVSGAGSFWNNQSDLYVGQLGGGNRLEVSGGAQVANSQGTMGNSVSASNNIAVVEGSGSLWNNQLDLYVGQSGRGNRLDVNNGATVAASNLFVGFQSSSTNNRVVVDGGTLRVTNIAGNGTLEVRRGTNVLNAGLIEADSVRAGTVGPQGILEFNGGTLSARSSRIANPSNFRIGNGLSPATLVLAGNGVHDFTGIPFVTVSPNAVLTGNGTLMGAFSTLGGSQLIPGASIGTMVFSSYVSLSGAVIMEISKNGTALTNDQIQVASTLTYGGSLSVTDLGPDALVLGDRFPLFSAGSYSGAFSVLTLPPLSPGLDWANKLLLDGSIEVIPSAPADRFWTNALGGNYQFPGNWLGNLVPRPQDNANFTNNADYQVNWSADALAANAFFNAQSGTVTQANTYAWSLTNSYIVGRDSVATSAVTHLFGALFVTNSAGSARLVVGQSGRGTYNLNGGDVVADYLFVTNNSPAVTNSIFNFNFGNLTTLHGSTISQSNDVIIGSVSNQTATWTMPGGTNRIANDVTRYTYLGSSNGARCTVTVTGSNTVWANSGSLIVGSFTAANQLVISNGGLVQSLAGQIGDSNPGGTNNEVIVTGPGSGWRMFGPLPIGLGANTGNRLVISDGGSVLDDTGKIGFSASDCEAVVTGPGSLWSNHIELHIGFLLGTNRLVVSNGAFVVASDLVSLGTFTTSFNNRVVVDGGTLRATNGAATGLLNILRGTTVLNAGLIEADFVSMTNSPQSVLQFNGGTLSAKNSRIDSGTILGIGNGTNPATMMLAGNGVHDFGGTLIVQVSSNAVLTGNGTLVGPVGVSNGGKLIPGASVGKIIFSNPPALQGTIVMEISKNGAALTNDQIQVTGTLTYGGSLEVSNLGPTALVVGDRFPLFGANSYTGAFSVVSLPSLPTGLDWTNKLLVDGSIEVIAVPLPKFASITVSGTNVMIAGTNGPANAPYAVLTATNVATPLSNWLSILTQQFNASGNFSFTNPIAPGELQRYFRIRTP